MTGMKPAAGRGSANGGGKSDDLGATSEIGRKLKQYYDELVSDEVPDRIMDLLRKLETSESSAQEAPKGGK
jgi:hypothetical protein